MSCGCAGCGNGGPCEAVKLPKGKQGNRGPQGPAATIAIGTVTAVPNGTPPTVTNSGTSGAAIFDFELETGADGGDGLNAFGTITTGWFVPGVGNNAGPLPVDNGSWLQDGQEVFVENIGGFIVIAHTSSTVTLQNTGDTGNVSPGTAVPDNSTFGPGGRQGVAGDIGPASWTLTTASFTQPAVNGTVTVAAGLVDWAGISEEVYIPVGGYYRVTTIFSSTSIQLQNLGYPGNAPPGVVISSGSLLTPGGRRGADGDDGTDGHTPVLTAGVANPSGGVDGDWYIQQVNGGKWQVWAHASGVWSTLVNGVITTSRLLGTGNTDPNTLSLVANANDYFFTQIGSVNAIWVYNGSLWVVSNSWTSGGGGTATLPSAAAASANIAGIGQDMGPLTWAEARVISWVPLTATHSTPGGTYQYPLEYPKVNLSMSADVVLNMNSYAGESQWRLQLTNTSGSLKNITYSSGVWKGNQGVSVPTTINAAEVIILVFEKVAGQPWVVDVYANGTPL